MFQVDAFSRIPVYEQLLAQLEKYLLSGILSPGDKMISVRQLSAELKVNPNTIAKAYGIMEQKGLTVSVPGRGVFIAQDAREKIMQKTKDKLDQIAEMTREMKLAGLSLNEILQAVSEAYGEEKK